MRWRKLGRIFDPGAHRLPHGCTAFAQAPQALVLGDRLRVYFSTRTVDSVTGKALSHVAFAEFDQALRLQRVSDHEVIPLGNLGTFDEHGIFPFSVLRRGHEIHAYTCGWSRRVSVSVETGIGLAISRDGGETFARVGAGPVLSATLNEPCLVGDGFVLDHEGVLHMWYIFGTSWRRFADDVPPDRTYKIGHATSVDGVTWYKDEARAIIADRLGSDESQALPTVVQVGDRWLMTFCYRESFDFRRNPDRGYRIGSAWSTDLQGWTRDDDSIGLETTPDAWDGAMQCYPNLFNWNGRVHLLYNGNAFGREGFGVAVLEA